MFPRAFKSALLWHFPYVFSIYLLVVAYRGLPPWQYASMLLYYPLLYLSTILLNDLFDFHADSKSGKRTGTSRRNLFFLFALSSSLCLLISISLPPFLTYFLFLALAVSFAYSSSPIKLKSKGIAGLMCSAFFERPAVLLSIMISLDSADSFTLPIFLLFLATHLHTSFSHQLLDSEGDRSGNILTLAVRLGKEKSRWLSKRLALLSSAASLLLLIHLSLFLGPALLFSVLPLYILAKAMKFRVRPELESLLLQLTFILVLPLCLSPLLFLPLLFLLPYILLIRSNRGAGIELTYSS